MPNLSIQDKAPVRFDARHRPFAESTTALRVTLPHFALDVVLQGVEAAHIPVALLDDLAAPAVIDVNTAAVRLGLHRGTSLCVLNGMTPVRMIKRDRTAETGVIKFLERLWQPYGVRVLTQDQALTLLLVPPLDKQREAANFLRVDLRAIGLRVTSAVITGQGVLPRVCVENYADTVEHRFNLPWPAAHARDLHIAIARLGAIAQLAMAKSPRHIETVHWTVNRAQGTREQYVYEFNLRDTPIACASRALREQLHRTEQGPVSGLGLKVRLGKPSFG